MATVEDFLTQFQNLEGDRFDQKRKSLFKLLNFASKHIKNKNEIDLLVKSIVPKTRSENIFVLEVLIHFRCFQEILNTFKSENIVLILKIIKQDWFFEEMPKNITPKQLVDEILPFTSFSTRMKIINRIASHVNNTIYVDKLFDLFEDKYGIKLAKYLLPACSENKVRSVFETFFLQLPNDVLLKLTKKNPNLLTFYCKTSEGKTFNHYPKSLMEFLAVNRFDIFWQLQDNFVIPKTFGRKITRKIIENKKSDVMKDAKKFNRVLKNRELIKRLSNDFEEFYCNLLPKNIENLTVPNYWDSEYEILKCVSKKKRFELFSKTFLKLYKTELIENLKFINMDLLQLIHDKEEKQKYLKLLLEENKPSMLKYQPTDISIPEIKQKIRLTSNMYSRKELLTELVDTCQENHDSNALLEVMKYFIARHRNEDIDVLRSFLYRIHCAFDLEKLSEDHWKCIKELITLLKLSKNNDSCTTYILKEIQWCFINNKPADEIKKLMRDFLKSDSNLYMDFDLFRNVPLLVSEQSNMTLFIDVIMEENSEEERNKILFELLKAIIRWNREHLNKKILIDSRLMESFRYMKKEKNTNVGYIINYFIFHEKENEEIINMYWSDYKKSREKEINCWFLKFKPQRVLSNIDTFLTNEYLNELNDKVLMLCLKYENLGIPQRIIEKCLNILNDDDSNNSHKADALRILSILMSGEEFVKIIKPYYPEQSDSSKIDLQDINVQSKYLIQSTIALNLKNTFPPSLALENLLPFCSGDYLKEAVRSLLYLMPHTPENKLEANVNVLISRPVSVRKNGIKLSFSLYCRQKAYEFLKHHAEVETNVSLRKYLFELAFRYIAENPYDEFWDLLKLCISKLDKNDSEAFEIVVDLNKIPKKYKATYITFVWDVMENNEKNGSTLNKKYALISSGCNAFVINELPQEFLNMIVCKNLFEENVSNENIENFVIKVLLCYKSKEDVQNYFNTIILHLKQSKNNKNYYGKRLSFVKQLCSDSLDLKDKNSIIKLFESIWRENFTPLEAFKEHIIFQLTLFYHCNNYDSFVIEVAKLYDSFVEKYGLIITHLFSNALQNILHCCLNNYNKLNDFSYNNDNVYEFLKTITEGRHSDAYALLVLNLISENNRFSEYTRMRLEDLVNEISKNCGEVVKIYLNCFKEYFNDK